MKKQYGTPEAEKLEFDYKDAIVASAGVCYMALDAPAGIEGQVPCQPEPQPDMDVDSAAP